jgi:hypothetical protein
MNSYSNQLVPVEYYQPACSATSSVSIILSIDLIDLARVVTLRMSTRTGISSYLHNALSTYEIIKLRAQCLPIYPIGNCNVRIAL